MIFIDVLYMFHTHIIYENINILNIYIFKFKNSYPVLCLGDSSTKTAIDVISYTCKGRGSSLPLDVGSESEIIDGIYMIIFHFYYT